MGWKERVVRAVGAVVVAVVVEGGGGLTSQLVPDHPGLHLQTDEIVIGTAIFTAEVPPSGMQYIRHAGWFAGIAGESIGA